MKRIAALIISVLLLSLAPTIVHASEDTVTAEAKGGNTAPTVNSLTLVEAGSDTQVIAMTPLTEYRVKATVGDNLSSRIKNSASLLMRSVKWPCSRHVFCMKIWLS